MASRPLGPTGPTARPARLPLALLAAVLVVAGGAALWADLAGPPPSPPLVSLVLTPLAAEPASSPAAAAKPAAPPAPAAAAKPAASSPPSAAVSAAPGRAAAPSPSPAPATPRPPVAAKPSRPAETVPPPPPPPAPQTQASPQPQAKAAPPRTPSAPSPPSTRPASPPQLAALPPPPAHYRPPPLTRSGGLAPAPDPSLVQSTPEGPLPVVAPDGRRAWQVYARPFNPADKRPRIAILITGLGPSSAATEAAIQGLPGGVSLAFWPYADDIGRWIRLARAAGHEVLLNLPMEPQNYPDFDPGPKTLLTSLSPEQNIERLDWALSRVTGYVGVADYLGARFTASRRDVTPVLEAIHRRGLVFVDSRMTAHSVAPEIAQRIGLPWVASTRFLEDPQVSRDAIDARLHELESIARVQHAVLGIGSPYPVTLERVAAWAEGLEDKGIALAPVTAVIQGAGAVSTR